MANATSTKEDKSSDFFLDSEKCLICLSPLQKQTVASLEYCQQVFCLQCVLQWAQKSYSGGAIEKKIKVRVQEKDGDDEEELSDAVICEECGRSDRRHQLQMCTDCDSRYHRDCLTPSLNSGHEGDWICPDCVVTPHHRVGSMGEEEISDGELIDLLAEVDETASTTSRLRPSTLNRSSSFAERRRSARVQSRTSSNPNIRPHTSWHVPKHLLQASKPAVCTSFKSSR